jgi:hypothetical protein
MEERTEVPISPDEQPPGQVVYSLDEALDLLAALEDARDVVAETDHLAVLAEIEHQIVVLNRRLGFDDPRGDVNGH